MLSDIDEPLVVVLCVCLLHPFCLIACLGVQEAISAATAQKIQQNKQFSLEQLSSKLEVL